MNVSKRPEFNEDFFLFEYETVPLCYRKESGAEGTIYFVKGKDYDGIIHHESVASQKEFPELYSTVEFLKEAARNEQTIIETSYSLYDGLLRLDSYDVFNKAYANSLDPSYKPEDKEETNRLYKISGMLKRELERLATLAATSNNEILLTELFEFLVAHRTITQMQLDIYKNGFISTNSSRTKVFGVHSKAAYVSGVRVGNCVIGRGDENTLIHGEYAVKSVFDGFLFDGEPYVVLHGKYHLFEDYGTFGEGEGFVILKVNSLVIEQEKLYIVEPVKQRNTEDVYRYYQQYISSTADEFRDLYFQTLEKLPTIKSENIFVIEPTRG